jgi:hypothetical protein
MVEPNYRAEMRPARWQDVCRLSAWLPLRCAVRSGATAVHVLRLLAEPVSGQAGVWR